MLLCDPQDQQAGLTEGAEQYLNAGILGWNPRWRCRFALLNSGRLALEGVAAKAMALGMHFSREEPNESVPRGGRY